MQSALNKAKLDQIKYLVGDSDTILNSYAIPALVPFSDEIIEFLNEVSSILMKDKRSRQYSDVMTLGFWLRRASVTGLRERFVNKGKKDADRELYYGRGVVFHIAPSNVPVNFAYSLFASLMMGNINIVRVPSKDFPQIPVIIDAIRKALEEHGSFVPYIVLVRYDRDKEINDALSSIADTRIVWGGDNTIEELRRSPLPPRSNEITFADRYSIAVIDVDEYLALKDKASVALDFYNDTYFSDQNACTSPRLVVWTGSDKDKREEAKVLFWDALHDIVEERYDLKPVQAVNKLTSACLAAVALKDIEIIEGRDNLIVRVKLGEIEDNLMEYRDNSGFFFEYDCDDILKLKPVCDNKACQTVGILGDPYILRPLLDSGIKGIDRIVRIGKTMDFDLIWDGYDLFSELTRIIKLG